MSRHRSMRSSRSPRGGLCERGRCRGRQGVRDASEVARDQTIAGARVAAWGGGGDVAAAEEERRPRQLI